MDKIDPTTKETYADGVRGVLRRWQRADYVRLHAGEMTAQEMRSVLAVLKAVAAEVDAYLPPDGQFKERDMILEILLATFAGMMVGFMLGYWVSRRGY